MSTDENIALQKIWKNVDSEINQKSTNELNLLLMSKAKQALHKFVVINATSIVVCIAVIVWLTITSLNRQHDFLLLINNAMLGAVVIVSLYYGLSIWYKLKKIKSDTSLKAWLGIRIDILSKWLTGRFQKLEFYLFPVLYILTFLSNHVYYSGLDFMELLKSEKFLTEDVWGILIFTPIILALGFHFMIKTRKYYLQKLDFLRDLYGRLGNLRQNKNKNNDWSGGTNL
jgi:amino acid transporter